MSIYAKSKIAFCFTTFIVLQAVRYASFSKMYLFAMLDYAKAGGGSRGSALYTDSTGELPGFPGCQTFGELYRCRLDQKMHGQEVQEVTLKEGTPSASRRPVRPLPDVDYFFENQWRIYRERMGMMD